MGIEQAFSDQTLLDVVSLLSARNESGRLKFAGGTMRGAFFFSKGKLVDAHLGPFSGFHAVNLAVSVGKARLSFDPSIESHTSSFKVPAERLILKERFGIETATLESAKPQPAKPEPTRAKIPGSVETIRTTSLLPTPLPLPQQFETKTSVPVQEAETGKLGYDSRVEIFLRGVFNNASARRNRPLLICVLFLVVIPTTVGLASYWNGGPESPVRNFSAAKTPETSAAPAAVLAPSQPDENLTKTLPADEPISLRPQPSLITSDKAIQKPEPNRLNPDPVKDNEVAKAIPDSPATQSEPAAKPSSRAIAVVVEIEDGRVTEAFIQQPQRGLAAYEATALRLARQRRFPKGTTRRETITLPVTPEQ